MIKRILNWIRERLKDLFYATGNEHLELGRVVTGLMTSLIIFSVYWNSIKLRQPIDLAGLLNGLALFVGAAGLGIGIKDWVRNKLIEKTSIDEVKGESK